MGESICHQAWQPKFILQDNVLEEENWFLKADLHMNSIACIHTHTQWMQLKLKYMEL